MGNLLRLTLALVLSCLARAIPYCVVVTIVLGVAAVILGFWTAASYAAWKVLYLIALLDSPPTVEWSCILALGAIGTIRLSTEWWYGE